MYTPVLKKLTGSTGWPTQAVVLPGNEVLFSLESASDYVKDDKKTSHFGFRCLVVGYEAVSRREHGLQGLEMELAYLGGLCSSSLMKRNLQLTQVRSAEYFLNLGSYFSYLHFIPVSFHSLQSICYRDCTKLNLIHPPMRYSRYISLYSTGK